MFYWPLNKSRCVYTQTCWHVNECHQHCSRSRCFFLLGVGGAAHWLWCYHLLQDFHYLNFRQYFDRRACTASSHDPVAKIISPEMTKISLITNISRTIYHPSKSSYRDRPRSAAPNFIYQPFFFYFIFTCARWVEDSSFNFISFYFDSWMRWGEFVLVFYPGEAILLKSMEFSGAIKFLIFFYVSVF